MRMEGSPQPPQGGCLPSVSFPLTTLCVKLLPSLYCSAPAPSFCSLHQTCPPTDPYLLVLRSHPDSKVNSRTTSPRKCPVRVAHPVTLQGTHPLGSASWDAAPSSWYLPSLFPQGQVYTIQPSTQLSGDTFVL